VKTKTRHCIFVREQWLMACNYVTKNVFRVVDNVCYYVIAGYSRVYDKWDYQELYWFNTTVAIYVVIICRHGHDNSILVCL
jgi:hypothetical protein